MCSPVDRLPTSVSHHPNLGEHHERGRQKIFRSQKSGRTAAKQCLLDMMEPWPGGITGDCGCLNRHVGYQDHQEFYMDGGWESPEPVPDERLLEVEGYWGNAGCAPLKESGVNMINMLCLKILNNLK